MLLLLEIKHEPFTTKVFFGKMWKIDQIFVILTKVIPSSTTNSQKWRIVTKFWRNFEKICSFRLWKLSKNGRNSKILDLILPKSVWNCKLKSKLDKNRKSLQKIVKINTLRSSRKGWKNWTFRTWFEIKMDS